MRRQSQYAPAFALALLLTLGVMGAGWALPANPYVSYVTFYDPLDLGVAHANQLTATVTYNQLSGLYHYDYTLVYSASFLDASLTDFSVGNMYNLAYTNPGCTYDFTMADSQDSVYWYIADGDAPVGQTINFWYDSIYSYKVVDVTVSGGMPSNGLTLGMVPEPGSLLALAFGLGGVLWTRLRRRS